MKTFLAATVAAAIMLTPSLIAPVRAGTEQMQASTKSGDRRRERCSILDFGAACDTQVLRWTQVEIQAGSSHLNVPNGWFNDKDTAKLIVIAGAGPGGRNLATKIVSIQSKAQVTLAETASSTVNVHNGYIAYGSDDAPAINAAIAHLPKWDFGEIMLPRGVCGVGSTIRLPGKNNSGFGTGNVTLRGEGRGVSWIVALAPMRSVIEEPEEQHVQANLFEFGIDGSGLADYGADIRGGTAGHHRDLYYNNDRIAGLHIGTNAVNADGTLTNPKSWYTNIWEFMADHCTIGFDKWSVMPHSAPLFGILSSGGDSHFSDMVVQGASVANVRDTGRANNFYTAVHAWGSPRYEFWVNGEVSIANSEVDGTQEAGVRTDSDGLTWAGGRMISLKKGSPVGFYFPTSSGHHSIMGADITDIPSSSYVSVKKGAALDNSIILIPGLAPSFINGPSR